MKQKIVRCGATWIVAVFACCSAVLAADLPAWDTPEPDRETHIDQLFEELQSAEEGFDARVTEKTILSVWSQSGSATVDLLMDRAASVAAEGDLKLGMSLLNRIIEIEPGYAEGWHRRSALHLETNNYTEAMVDLQKTLVLEPRQFIAIRTLGHILMETGDNEAALAAFRIAIKLNPHMDEVSSAIETLTHSVEGRGI